MELIVIAGFAVLVLLLIQHKKASAQRPARVRARRDARTTHVQTNVPEDRC